MQPRVTVGMQSQCLKEKDKYESIYEKRKSSDMTSIKFEWMWKINEIKTFKRTDVTSSRRIHN